MTDVQEDLPDPTRPNWTWVIGQFLMRIVFAVWFRFRARGLKHLPESGGGLVLSNHQSHLDPMLLQIPLKRPIGFLARENLFQVPFVAWVLRNHYVLGINRGSARASSIREAVRRMRHGFFLGVFPEGTRTPDGSVGEFKRGFVAMVRRARLPIYPVGISGAFEAMPRGSWFVRPWRIRIVYGEPLTYEELEPLCKRGHEQELVDLVQERVFQCQREAEAWRLG